MQWFTRVTIFVKKKSATHRLCTVIAIEYNWAEDYLLYTYSIFHTVLQTWSHDCCRYPNLREMLQAKFWFF